MTSQGAPTPSGSGPPGRPPTARQDSAPAAAGRQAFGAAPSHAFRKSAYQRVVCMASLAAACLLPDVCPSSFASSRSFYPPFYLPLPEWHHLQRLSRRPISPACLLGRYSTGRTRHTYNSLVWPVVLPPPRPAQRLARPSSSPLVRLVKISLHLLARFFFPRRQTPQLVSPASIPWQSNERPFHSSFVGAPKHEIALPVTTPL